MSESIESAERFTGLAEGYDRYRPRYPAIAVATILADMRVPADVVDIGAGTGISSRALAATGARVIAIEPNEEMRSVASASGVDARDGRADATGLPDDSADVVCAFQAFHWFTEAVTVVEFARLLRPGGRIALVWNERDTRGDALTAGVRSVEKKFGDTEKLAGADFYNDALVTLLADGGFSRVRRLQFDNEQRLDRDGLLGRVFSTSFAPRSGPRVAATIEALDDLHARFCDNSGHVTMVYRTTVIIGER